jgi:60 kDa SS-A/Ro ribonucleoprotein
LNDPNVWEALLYGEDRRGMPLGALVRNLGNLSKCGLLTAGSEAARYVIEQLGDPRRIAASRLHPMAFFVAGRTYAAGRGVRGSGMWAPVGAVVDALERAFEAALGNVQPAGRRVLVAVDASGSMSSPVLGYPNVSARDASLALAHVIARTEPSARLIGFTDGTNTAEFAVAADERLRDFAQRFNERVEPRGTDCAEPFAWAGRQSASFDAVVTLTDSETWAGSSHPHEAFRAYRERFGRGCRAIVAATTATRLTVLPDEPNVLQVAGFDAALPQLLASFLREGPGPAAAA